MNNYRRTKRNGKYYYEHDEVWKKNYGDIPKGMIVHHIDGNKRNNDIKNLMLLSIRDHNRLHAGFIKQNDLWYKTCSCCGQTKEVNEHNWYLNKKDNSVATGECKLCFKRKMAIRKRNKKFGLCCD